MDFDRQKIIGNYIANFYCAEKAVVIEVDGSSHDSKAEYDAVRDAYLTGLNLTVIHLLDRDVKSNLAGVMQFLQNHPALINSSLHPMGHNTAFLKKWNKPLSTLIILRGNGWRRQCHRRK